MTWQQVVMWAVVLFIGLPASWRNITAAALVVSWALAQGTWLITDDNLPIDFYFMADIAVIAIIYGKAISRFGPKVYESGWHQARCLITDLTIWDRAIVGLFVLCMWPAYVLEFDAYAKWHWLWLATILQFVFAGAETFFSWRRTRLAKAESSASPGSLRLSLRGNAGNGC